MTGRPQLDQSEVAKTTRCRESGRSPRSPRRQRAGRHRATGPQARHRQQLAATHPRLSAHALDRPVRPAAFPPGGRVTSAPRPSHRPLLRRQGFRLLVQWPMLGGSPSLQDRAAMGRRQDEALPPTRPQEPCRVARGWVGWTRASPLATCSFQLPAFHDSTRPAPGPPPATRARCDQVGHYCSSSSSRSQGPTESDSTAHCNLATPWAPRIRHGMPQVSGSSSAVPPADNSITSNYSCHATSPVDVGSRPPSREALGTSIHPFPPA